MDPRAEAARDLIVAIFRLAVADYLGLSYSYDGPMPARRTRRTPFRDTARLFLTGPWAAYLADLVGLQASAIWREVSRLAGDSHAGTPLGRPAIAA